MVEIRKAQRKDFEEFFKLEKEFMLYNNLIEPIKFFRYSLDKDKNKKSFLEAIKNKDQIFLVLEDRNNLFGYFLGKIENINKGGHNYKFPDVGYVESVFISKKYRLRGFFKKFMQIFFRHLRKRNIRLCSLHVDCCNGLAIKVYKKFGFAGPASYKFILKL